MSRQVTLEIADDVAETLARKSPDEVKGLLDRALRVVIAADARDHEPVAALSDQEVLDLVDLEMPAQADARQVELMRARRERKLTTVEEAEFWELVRLYERLQLRKSEALVEAVRRGLRPPLAP